MAPTYTLSALSILIPGSVSKLVERSSEFSGFVGSINLWLGLNEKPGAWAVTAGTPSTTARRTTIKNRTVDTPLTPLCSLLIEVPGVWRRLDDPRDQVFTGEDWRRNL